MQQLEIFILGMIILGAVFGLGIFLTKKNIKPEQLDNSEILLEFAASLTKIIYDGTSDEDKRKKQILYINKMLSIGTSAIKMLKETLGDDVDPSVLQAELQFIIVTKLQEEEGTIMDSAMFELLSQIIDFLIPIYKKG